MLILRVANLLKQSKDEVGKHVLFLGSDMPLKPRGETLSTLLLEASEALCNDEIPGFSELPEEIKAAESQRLLARIGLTEKPRQRALSATLADLELSEGWIWLAQLIKAGYFSLIFSFSLHDLLERGLLLEKMSPGEDYNLVVAGLDSREIVTGAVQKSARITVVKLGGDLKRGLIPMLPEEVTRNIRPIGGAIHSISGRSLLMVAHSPADADIIRYLSRSGGPVYWISPKAPVEERERFDAMKIEDPRGMRVHAFSPEVASFLSQRGSRDNLLTREKGEFDYFFASLQNRLLRRGLDTQISYIKRKTLISTPDKPFKFLQPFDQKDVAVFYGRESETAELLRMVKSNRLSVVVGRSGVGKTSLICGGVMPALEEDAWLSLVLRPLGDPLARIRAKVMDWVEVEQAVELDSLAQAPLAAFLRRAMQILEGQLAIFLDQFEEAFTKLPEETRMELVRNLAGCLQEHDLPVNVVLSLREDRFADLCDIRDALPTIFDNVFRIRKLSRDAARLAIIKPVDKLRLTIEPTLVEQILNDLDSDGIDPSELELVMYAIHFTLPPTERMLSNRLYRSLGGTEPLLRDCVENTLRRLPWRDRPLARRALKELVLATDQRALVSAARIAQHLDLKPEAASSILWDLEDASLVRRVENEKGDGEYELVHDFLADHIGQWLSEKETKVKETQAMLQRELRGFRARGTLLPPDKIRLLNEQRDSLSFADEELRFIATSSLDASQDISPWLEKVTHLDNGWESLISNILARGTEPQKNAALHLVERLAEPPFIQSLLSSLPPALAQERSALSTLLTRGKKTLVSEVVKGKADERKRAISALARIGTHKAAAPLIKALGDPDADIRHTASEAIQQIGGEKTADMLVHRLFSPDGQGRWDIADTLVKLADKVGIATIEKALAGVQMFEGAWTSGDFAPATPSLGGKISEPQESLARDYVVGRLLTRKRQVDSAREILSRAHDRCQSPSDAAPFSAALAELDDIVARLDRGFFTWKTFHKDPSHCGHTQEIISPPLSLAWSFKTDGQLASSPVIDRGVAFLPSRNGQLYALDVNSGALLWQQKVASHVDSSPAVEDDNLFLGTNDGQLVSLETATGRFRWRFNAGGQVRSSPTIHNGLVFFGCWDGRLYAVSTDSGEQLWSADTDAEIYSSPAIAADYIVVGNWDGKVIAFLAQTGHTAWRFSTPEEVYSSPAIAGHSVFIGSDDAHLYCLSLADASLIWRAHLGGRVRSSPAVVEDKVIVGSSDGHLYCLSVETGAALWKVKTEDEITSSPAVSDKVVFFCSRDGSLSAVHLESGELLWRQSTAFGISSSPAVADGKFIVGMNYSEICAFQGEPSP